MKTIITIAESLLIGLAVLGFFIVMTSCTLTIAPDGARTWAVSGQEAARAIEILSAK